MDFSEVVCLKLSNSSWTSCCCTSLYSISFVKFFSSRPFHLLNIAPLFVQAVNINVLLDSFAFVVADVLSALLIRAIGQNLQRAYYQSLRLLKINLSKNSGSCHGHLKDGYQFIIHEMYILNTYYNLFLVLGNYEITTKKF